MKRTPAAEAAASRVLIVDHRDSFVCLLGEQFARLGAEVEIHRADAYDLDAFRALLEERAPRLVVLSPGPGTPRDAGVTPHWLATRPAERVLGVCLGHQAIAEAAGATVRPSGAPVHGRASLAEFANDPLFDGLPRRMPVGRYHSLIVDDLPETLEPLATLVGEPDAVMALRHRALPQVGVQFHPESVLTPHGGRLLGRLLASS